VVLLPIPGSAGAQSWKKWEDEGSSIGLKAVRSCERNRACTAIATTTAAPLSCRGAEKARSRKETRCV
jgi:hypothetical protein